MKPVTFSGLGLGQGLSAGEHSIGYIPLGGPGGLPPGQGLKNITPDKLVRLG